MPKKPTKAIDNVFCKARLGAATCNGRLASREAASEELGIDRTRLARIELDTLTPYPEEVLIMSEYYDAPELANYYCSQMCPLGKKTVLPAEMQSLDRLTIRILSALTEAGDIKDTILDVVADGVITADETVKVREVCAALDRIAVTAQELRIYMAKNLKGGAGA